MSEMTTILIRQDTRERLKAVGKKGETYDHLIGQLLNEKEGAKP